MDARMQKYLTTSWLGWRLAPKSFHLFGLFGVQKSVRSSLRWLRRSQTPSIFLFLFVPTLAIAETMPSLQLLTPFVYSLCDEGPASIFADHRWCVARGGDADCNGAVAIQESNIISISQSFEGATHPLTGDSGWGQTVSSWWCWSGSPVYSNTGVLLVDHRKLTFYQGVDVAALKVRTLTAACPPNENWTLSGETCTRPDETYTLTLKPESATIEPGKTYSFTATVTKQDGGAPSKSVPVSVKVDVDPTSGGHDHGETYAKRDKGTVSPTAGTNSFSITFGSTEVSGTHTITATCDLCSNSTETATVYVKVEGLDTLTDSPSFDLVGGETGKTHHDNHYLTTAARENLLGIVADYNAAFPDGPHLYLNDASLVWGGKFDISGKWSGDHYEHQRGVVIDIRANQDVTAIPESRFAQLEIIARNNGGAFAKLHCKPPYTLMCPGCIMDNRPNRHYHIRLLGKNFAY